MHNNQIQYQNTVAQGLVSMLFLLLTMFITDIVELIIQGDFALASQSLAKDPGITGLWFLACLICVNIIVQMLVRTVPTSACKWWVFGFVVLYGLFFLAHQVAHLINGEGFDIHFILDTTHHIVATWTAWAAYKWANRPALIEQA